MAPPPGPWATVAPTPADGEASASRPVPPQPAQVDLATALAEAERLVGEGQYTPAVQILGTALAQAERTHDPHGAVVRSLRKQYAKVLLMDGRLGPAQTEFTRLAQMAAADHGRDSAEALNFRLQAAQCREQSGDVSGSLAEYQAILAALLRLPSPDQQQALTLRDRIGRLLIAAGKPREAWDMLLGLLQDKERLLGPQHPDALALRGTLAQLAAAG
jgi:hypothetical protein